MPDTAMPPGLLDRLAAILGATGAGGCSRMISSMKTLICLVLSRSSARNCGLRANSNRENPMMAVTVSRPARINR